VSTPEAVTEEGKGVGFFVIEVGLFVTVGGRRAHARAATISVRSR
jgi:hypothetical protein